MCAGNACLAGAFQPLFEDRSSDLASGLRTPACDQNVGR